VLSIDVRITAGEDVVQVELVEVRRDGSADE
jgi:hypothetical protein